MTPIPVLCVLYRWMARHLSVPLAALVLTMSALFPAWAASSADSPSDTGKTQLLWLGQSAVRLTTPGGKVILIDPFITQNPKTPAQYKNLDALGRIDLILVTHAHADHLGDGPELAKKQHIPLIGSAGLDQSLVDLGVLPAELAPRMDKSGTITPLGEGIKITMVHAEHTSALEWLNPATHQTETHVGGDPVGFIIELENGFKLWVMGDTGLFSDMKFIADYYRPDLVLMPIGGHYTMDPKDAAYAVRYWIHPRLVLPYHYGTFPVLTGTPEEFIKAIGPTRTKVLDLKPGGTLTF